MSDAPKRFNLYIGEGGGYCAEDSAGKFVRFSDFDALAKERDELRAEGDLLTKELDRAVEGWSKSQNSQIDALDRAEKAEAEAELLRGDIQKAFVWERDARPAGYATAICKVEEILEAALQRKEGNE